MANVKFIHTDGREEFLEVSAGTSLMHAATGAGIDGIVAECGGAAMCATCHVYIEVSDVSRLVPVNEVENEMLDSTSADRRPTSRLSCQIVVTENLDGLVVYLPETQT